MNKICACGSVYTRVPTGAKLRTDLDTLSGAYWNCKCGSTLFVPRSLIAQERVRSLLEWMMDKNQEDRRVTIGCSACKESRNLLVATALTAWLNPFHSKETCNVWIKNPFRK